jgi:hypothetical protein
MKAMLYGQDLAHIDESLVFLGVQAGDQVSVLLPLLCAVAGGRGSCRSCGGHFRDGYVLSTRAYTTSLAHNRVIEHLQTKVVKREARAIRATRGQGRG